MAVTFNQIPKLYSPSDNELLYVYSSDETAQANFSFVVEIYFNGGKVGESRTYVEDGIKSHINISDVVNSYLSTPQLPTTFISSHEVAEIYIKVTESYGSPATLHANATSSTTKIWKASISDEDFISIDFDTDYKSQLFFSNKPDRTTKVPLDTDVYLSMLCGNTLQDLNLETYDSSGAILNTYTSDFSYDIWDLNLNSTILIGEGIDMTGVAYITVYIASSELWTVYYESNPCDDLNMVYWLNEYGVYEQFNFNYKHELSASTSSNGYTSKLGGWSGGVYVFDLNSGNRNYRVVTNRQGKLYTSYLSELIQNWLVSIIESPRHYLNSAPFKLTTASYIKEQDEYQELISLEIGYDFSHIKKSVTL